MFDSKEEEYFSYWLDELKAKGFVKEYKTQYPQFEIIPPTNKTLKYHGKKSVLETECSFLQSLTYTPDFYIVWTDKAKKKLVYIEDEPVDTERKSISYILKKRIYAKKVDGELVSVIDIKPAFDFHKNTMSIKFPLIQKMLFYVKQVYVQRVRPLKENDIFANTFTPRKIIKTKRNKPRKFKFDVVTIKTFLDEND